MDKKTTAQKIYHNIVIDSRKRTDGSHKIIYRVQIDGIKKDYSTGKYWNKEAFDTVKQQVMPRYKGDPDVMPTNHHLQEIKARANRIMLRFFVDNATITIKKFDELFQNFESNENFIWFAEQRAKHLYEKEVLTSTSYRVHKTAINKLKEFTNDQVLPISEITLQFIEEFHAWARKKKFKHNTICGFHKNIKKYLSIAVAEKKLHTNPYKDFKFAFQDGDRAVLTQDEVLRLKALYLTNKVQGTEKEVLRRFLFSCTTGIRISDTHRIKAGMIKENVLKFTPYKTRNKGKTLKIPLSKFSLSLIEGRTGLLFEPVSDKHINFCLKVLGGKAEIDKVLTYHVARDTFGTIFIELGGDPVSLKDIMGHTSIKTTMIYVKMCDRRKHDLMNNFDRFL